MIRNFFKRKRKDFGIYPAQEVVEKSCGIILFRMEQGERKFLLLHYPSGHWDFPKGHVEHADPTEFDTARRELHEETGITDIEFIPDYRETMYYEFARGKKQKVKKTVVYFLAQTEAESVQISHEHQGFKWLSYEEAFKRLTFENARGLLVKASTHLST